MSLPESLTVCTITELGTKLRACEFTSVQLTEFFLDRLERIGPQLNAVVTVTRDRALREAAQADAEFRAGRDRGPLHGIPYGVKDLFTAKGSPTTWGAPPFKEQMIDADAAVVEKLRDAGAVLVAKLALIEIAGGLGYRQANATFTGPGLNPWNIKHWAGGSSSGSGAAVGAGLVPFAIGTETWGSIMTPAGYCGVTGLRPTFGLISRYGAMTLSWTLDKVGPLARTAQDCCLILNALIGLDVRDVSSVEATQLVGHTDVPKFKLAVLSDATQQVQPAVKANFETSLKVLERFSTINEIKLPDLPYGSVASLIISCEMAAAFEDLAKSGQVWEMTADEDRWGLFSALTIPAKDYINAMRIRGVIQRELDAALAPFDAVLCPTLPTVAYPIDRSWDEYRKGTAGSQIGGASNVAGIPAISVPNGFGEEGLPTAIQFCGRAFSDNRLLAIAAAYQHETTWHRERPTKRAAPH
jgi:aspartyl-tRNA(Asn)/glutamyl-tRNA(Gln) amidotransferase subunit A